MSIPIATEAPAKAGRTMSEFSWAVVGFLIFLLNALVLPFGSQAVWPPRGEESVERFLIVLVSAGLAAFCLWRSGKCGSWTRIYYAIGIAFAVIFVAFLMQASFHSTSDYLWPEGVILCIGLMAWGWKAHHQWLTIGIPIALTWWFWGAFSPPTSSLPATQTVDGLTVRLSDVTRTGCRVESLSTHSSDGRQFDAQRIVARATIGSYISGWTVHPGFAGRTRGDSFWDRLPSWARSVNVSVDLPSFPSSPTASVTLPLGTSRLLPVSSSTAGQYVRVANPRWMNSAHTDLSLDITMSVPDAGWITDDSRIVSDSGKELDTILHGASGTGKEDIEQIEISGLTPSTKWIRVENYSAAQMAASQITLHFDRVPINS